MMVVERADVMEIAARLAGQAGLPPPLAVTALTGGKNNRVFRLDGSHVLKLYHHDPSDPRDRLRAEWRFLSYAWAHGVRNIPEPMAHDEAAHAGLYTLLPGRAPEIGSVGADHVEAALAFLLSVNRPPRRPETLDPGSEACFSLDEHIATIDRRVERLTSADLAQGETAALICGRLRADWAQVRTALLSQARGLGIRLDQSITEAEVCISPSDFGFHNALTDEARTGFIDFEYAGRDDPAKLVCDFFCQPEIPVPLEYRADFTRRLIAGLGLDAVHEARCAMLLDAYRVKWACIILNDFLPLGAVRRSHANLPLTEARRAAQLARATAKLDELGNI